ncbi:MAG TPA: iron-containing redox enzyme family protein [Terriglobales bacterium]|nr:iron-containing redox enzyme family protein [Terriglobales bacterium]
MTGRALTAQEFFQELDARIAQYDLLCHPFYKAWSAGELTAEDLGEYALDYYPHVRAFPAYLAAFGIRLEEGELRRAVLANMRDEQGGEDTGREQGRAHSELWLDFAEAMGAARSCFGHPPVREVGKLVDHFTEVASKGRPEEALATFYAYEVQVPRIVKEKDRRLREKYGASERACRYFVLHTIADLHHAEVWRRQLTKLVESDPEAAARAWAAGESAAKALWTALDGIAARRVSAVAA